MSREALCGFVIVKSVRYKGWDGAGLANVASDIAKTVLPSRKASRYNNGPPLTRFTADSVCAAAAPQHLIAPSSNSQQSLSLPPPPHAAQALSPPLHRSSSADSGGLSAISVSVGGDDAAASAELLAVLSSAGLVPVSCRQRMMLALLSMGIGSEKALAAALYRDPAFLEQVISAVALHPRVL